MFYFLFLEPFHFLDFSDEFFYALLFKKEENRRNGFPLFEITL